MFKAMKAVLLFFCIWAGTSSPANAQAWHFAIAFVDEKLGTNNYYPTKYGYSWIKDDGNSGNLKALFKSAVNSQFSRTDFEFIATKSKSHIAIVKIVYDEKRDPPKKLANYYKVYSGKSASEVKSKIDAHSKQYGYLSTSIVELFELEKLTPKLNSSGTNPINARSIR